MAANLVDMIPNATSTPLTWLVAGALLGRLEYRAPVPATTAGELPLAAGPPERGPPIRPRPALAATRIPAAGQPLAPGRIEAGYTRQTARHDRKAAQSAPADLPRDISGKTPT
jgi:hypothetical protein